MIRTRFAPSPTGSLHIGGLRTALFNWLFARANGGDFYLRIEDTDQKRYYPNALHTLYQALNWAGIDWDEGPDIGGNFGPYIQSERLNLYRSTAMHLVDIGRAYYAFETPEELEAIRKVHGGYDRSGRLITRSEAEKRIQRKQPYVIRFKAETEGDTIIEDIVQGKVVFPNEKVQDAVLLKADGFPTYHLAHVEDDFRMHTSHVIRAAEWLPSAPLHIQLWDALDYGRPQYAHLPVMLNPNGKGKMSKRNPPKDAHGNVIPVMVHDYIEAGYLPEAMLNFLAGVGWSIGGERELFSIDEALDVFQLQDVNPANSAFPYQKLMWMNGEYIHDMPTNELSNKIADYLVSKQIYISMRIMWRIAEILRTRIKKFEDILPMINFLIVDQFHPAPTTDLVQKKMTEDQAIDILYAAEDRLSGIPEAHFTSENLHATILPLIQEFDMNNSQIFGLLRVAVTAQRVSPPTFESMELLGKEEVLYRINLSIDKLAGIV